jgi:hypothetical protein
LGASLITVSDVAATQSTHANDLTLSVSVEVSGCPTTCMHCWALGGNYGTMPLDDAAFVLEALERFCSERRLRYSAYPMHEVTAHPAAPDIIRLFAPHLGEHGPGYDPILTPGTPLASRPDWKDVVDAAKECGAHALWVAFHGFGAEHDRQLNRPGAFEETCLAVQRAHECGLGVGANVFLTKPGLCGFDRMLVVLLQLPLGTLWIGPASYIPTSRGRRYEALRPELTDLLRIAELVLEVSDTNADVWRDLFSYTEAAWARRAFEGDWPATEPSRELRYQFVCRRNLDLYTGTTGIYHHRHGNLRRDGAEKVLERALAYGPVCDEEIYLGDGPSSPALAASWGDQGSTRVYFQHRCVRYCWLDRARRA